MKHKTETTLQSRGSSRPFDLNIERILEDWEVFHALREVIANALDEQMLTDSSEPEIRKDQRRRWFVRDFGRGLKYQHLTQKENEEKLKHPKCIGKFGIGLKDALATFDRHNVGVSIKSRYGDITIGKSEKHGFEDLVTLHAYVYPPSDPSFIGTEFTFEGVQEDDIRKAKDLFLKFSGEAAIESTKFGDVLKKKSEAARIYVNGVKVADEENFLFSYNITALNEAIRKALNRERSNVGRTAYSDRVRAILVSCRTKEIAQSLADDLQNFERGETRDELKWLDVQEHAVKILSSLEKVVFLTPEEMVRETMMIDEARNSGYKIITIPSNLKDKIRGLTDFSGNPIRDLEEFSLEYKDSFEFKFIDPGKLKPHEKEVFNRTDEIVSLIGGMPKLVKELKISETMRKELGELRGTDGVWEAGTGRIIIKRSVLKTLQHYAGTLLHEIAHATSGADDVTREFELELTESTGLAASKAIQN